MLHRLCPSTGLNVNRELKPSSIINQTKHFYLTHHHEFKISIFIKNADPHGVGVRTYVYVLVSFLEPPLMEEDPAAWW